MDYFLPPASNLPPLNRPAPSALWAVKGSRLAPSSHHSRSGHHPSRNLAYEIECLSDEEIDWENAVSRKFFLPETDVDLVKPSRT